MVTRRYGVHELQFKRNKERVLRSQNICGICGLPVDKTLKYPNPMAPSVDHIIPINRGGHPSDIDNLQLAHWICNRKKSDKLFVTAIVKSPNNRDLPLSCNWTSYKADE